MHRKNGATLFAFAALAMLALLACQTAELFQAEAGQNATDTPDATLTALWTTDTPAATPAVSPTATETEIQAARPTARPTRLATPRIIAEPTRTIGQSPRSTTRPNGRAFGNLPSGARILFGQITAVNGNQITLQARGRNTTGGTLTVDLTGSTQYVGGSQSDLRVGIRIAGYGTANGDGSITAQQVAINPSFGGGTPLSP